MCLKLVKGLVCANELKTINELNEEVRLISEGNDSDYLKINEELKDARAKLVVEQQNKLILEDENEELRNERTRLQNENDGYRAQLDEENTAYTRPEYLNRTSPYQPKRHYPEGWVYYLPTEFYSVTDSIKKLVKQKRWRELDFEEKVKSIWQFVMSENRYISDGAHDHWQFAEETLYRKGGDCEDTTVLFVTLCRASGVPPTRVWNAVGWVKSGKGSFGHSYPIVRLNDGDWYVFETTVNWASNPKRFKTLLEYDASMGLHNWVWAGRIIGGDRL